MDIRRVGVLGCGQMGSGIAQVAAAAGYSTVALEATQQLCERGRANIIKRLDRLVQKGSIDATQKSGIEGRLSITTDDAQLADCDIVIEAIVERLDEKTKLWATLGPMLKPGAILASNTSSISITEMMTATSRPERFIGIHFMNPVPVMDLVEVIKTIATANEVVEDSVAFVRTLGKTPVRTTDRPGFIVNRLLIPYLMDAIRAFEEGTASIEDIDTSMKLGCGHPMGPFILLDFIGLDTAYYIANILVDEFHEARFAPPGLLKRMVIAGWHGRKSGKGFYDYSDPNTPKVVDQLRGI
jgi:3-hydroxybutyryl-CoA dehydrogenase